MLSVVPTHHHSFVLTKTCARPVSSKRDTPPETRQLTLVFLTESTDRHEPNVVLVLLRKTLVSSRECVQRHVLHIPKHSFAQTGGVEDHWGMFGFGVHGIEQLRTDDPEFELG